MWLQRFTNNLLQRPWQAIVLAFVSTFVPVVGIIGILIAALITLCKGVKEGAIVTLAATLPYLISFYLTGHGGDISLTVLAAVGVAVISNVLTWIFAVMLRRQASWSQILQIAALTGVLVVSVVHLAYPNVADWWGTQLQSYYTQATTAAGSLAGSVANTATTTATATTTVTTAISDTQLEAINATKEYATGLMVAAILFNALLQLVVARWWQGKMFHPGMLRRELHHIRLSRLAGVLFILSLVFSYLGNTVVLDIMPILYLLFCAAGLSLLHYLLGLMKSTAIFWLMLMYFVFFVWLPTTMVIVAGFALIDIGFNLRKQFKQVI